jgi:hypothetical protein
LNRESYHIDHTGQPAYQARFKQTFGFYCDLAAVQHKDSEESAGLWCHIDKSGIPVYKERWAWCGNFSQIRGMDLSLCPVMAAGSKEEEEASYYYISDSGKVVAGPFAYAGDFTSQGFSVVWTSNTGKPGVFDGTTLSMLFPSSPSNKNPYLDMLPPHKGELVVKDSEGWLFEDLHKLTLDQCSAQEKQYKRFKESEPHYNGQAFVQLKTGQKAIVRKVNDLDDKLVSTLQQSEENMEADLMELALGYCKPLALKLALKLSLLQKLHDQEQEGSTVGDFALDKKTNDNPFLNDLKLQQLVLGVCAEAGLCAHVSTTKNLSTTEKGFEQDNIRVQQFPFKLTQKGKFLITNEKTLNRCCYWLQDRYLNNWLMPGSLTPSQEAPHSIENLEQLSRDQDRLILSQKVLRSYAEEDWSGIGSIVPISLRDNIAEKEEFRVVDVGGGSSGILLKEVAKQLKQHQRKVNLELICLDRPAVAKIAIAEYAGEEIQFVGGDFFDASTIPSNAPLYLLSRVLHDWEDDLVVSILKNIFKVSALDAELVVVERNVTQQRQHAALSLHMYLLHRSFERTEEQWNYLFTVSGWRAARRIEYNGHTVVNLVKFESK